MEKRTVAASTCLRNPQAIFGDDVISRISAVLSDQAALPRLQTMVVGAVDWGALALCRQARIDPKGIGALVAVGNSTMITCSSEKIHPRSGFSRTPHGLSKRGALSLAASG